MPRCRVSRDCYDLNGQLVKAGGVALLAPDPKTRKLPTWAEEVTEEKPVKKEPAKE